MIYFWFTIELVLNMFYFYYESSNHMLTALRLEKKNCFIFAQIDLFYFLANEVNFAHKIYKYVHKLRPIH